MFGSVLTSSNVLATGQQSTFTFESGAWFFWDNLAEIQSLLNERIANIGQVVSIKRSLLSDRYVVTVIPTAEVNLSTWISVFDSSWRDMGYNSIMFISAEGGAVSSQPGGIVSILPEISGTVGSTVSEIIKPLFPYILVGIVIYAGIQMLPQIIHSRS